MAPTTRRSGGSGSGLPGASLTSGTALDAAASGPGASAGRVYRSGRVPQQHQIRFPRQRKVVKKYGRPSAARPPVQRTLTQIGYAMPPLSGLHGLDNSLNEDWDGESSTSVHVAHDNSCPGTESTLPGPAPRASKRRKTTQRGRETATPSSSFHTQTLTQFVMKKNGASTGGDDENDDENEDAGDDGKDSDDGDDGNDDNDFGLAATIRDSEDEYSLESPVAKAGVSESRQAEAGERLMATPTKPRQEEPAAVSKPVFSTPSARRTEIPSSQPSPFTPLLLLGRYHSPLGRQRSSPLSSKNKGAVVPLPELDTSPLPLRRARREPVLKHPKRVIPDSLSTTSSTSQRKSPLRVLSPREIAKRSAPQDDGEARGALFEEESLSLPARDTFTSRLRSAARNDQQAVPSLHEEIPDSDDEDGGVSGPYDGGSSAVYATKPGDEVDAGHAIETASSTLSSPLSSPSVSEPDSPTPRPKKRVEVVIKSSPPSRIEVGDNATALRGRGPSQGGSQPGASQAEDTQTYSQAVESQRVPLEVIRAMGPQTDGSDIIISTHPEQVRKITSGIKDHEFRGYKIPGTVTRLWIYSTQPVCELRYMAAIDPGFRKPGEIDSQSGVGNAEFNSGQLVAKFAYKINQVYQLNNPVPLDLMKRNGWVDGPPQRYAFVPPAVVGALLGNLQRALLDRTADKDLSVSQEIEAQLLSDMADTQSSQRERHTQLLDSPPAARGSEAGMHPPRPRVLSGTAPRPENPAGTTPISVKEAGKPSRTWPSQATTATSLASEEQDKLAKSAAGAAETAAICDFQSQYASSPLEPGTAIPRPELDFDPSSISSEKGEFGEDSMPHDRKQPQSPQLPQMTRGPQTRRLRRQRSALRNAQASSAESTQIVLPDSLYEEVQQAPPAVILDSDDSDG